MQHTGKTLIVSRQSSGDIAAGRYELHDGEVMTLPAPGVRHHDIVWNAAELLRLYARGRGGKTIVSPAIAFSDSDVLQPDVAFFERAREHLLAPDKPIRAAPDLVIDVLSPDTEAVDRGQRLPIYARHGVRECWLIDPDGGHVEAYQLIGHTYELHQVASGGELLQSVALPQLRLPASLVFTL